jgi:hypothetical protein
VSLTVLGIGVSDMSVAHARAVREIGVAFVDESSVERGVAGAVMGSCLSTHANET